MDREQTTSKERRNLAIAGIVLIAAAIILVAILYMKRGAYISTEIKGRSAADKAGPEVRVVAAVLSSGERSVSLVGEARPYATATLYAKVSGYLREVRVDKGQQVKAGQILAVIESPELDRQYESALADAQDKRRDAVRAKALVQKGYISQQDADHADTAAKQSEANAAALLAQKDYEVIRAPFNGTVTARFADPGALVQSAVNAQTTALPVVTLSTTDRLRVYIYLDQRDAAFVHVGDHADVSDAARPEISVKGSVTRISGELDERTRTLLAEIDLDNSKGTILAGGFVQVALTLKSTPHVEIPAPALLMKGEKPFVAVITKDSRVNFRPVIIFDSDAKIVRIGSGLEDGELVVLNPGWGITDGENVRTVRATP